jgi:hypothetical protein
MVIALILLAVYVLAPCKADEVISTASSHRIPQGSNDELIDRSNPDLALVAQHLDRNVVIVPAQHQVDG